MVASMFANLGAEVIDADQLAREVVEPGQPALEEIATAFGREILLPDGRLDRGKLARIIFADPISRARLNAITHPRIQERMATEMALRGSRPGVLIVDIPLLYENDRTGTVDNVIVVWVDTKTQLRRLVDRDRLTADEAREEEDGAGRGARRLALHADELANPAARSRHAMEEEQDASHDAGEPEDQAGKRIDQLQRRQATPEVALPRVRRQLQHGQDKLKPVQSQRLRA